MANAPRGTCINFGNCIKADTGELIDIIDGCTPTPNCPECGLELLTYNKNSRINFIIVIGIMAFVAIGSKSLFKYISSVPITPTEFSAPTLCSPLLMEGKKSLFQRVLIKPDSRKSMEFGGPVNQAMTPFSRYYVYDRKTNNGEEWLNIGSNVHCKKDGWVKAKDTLEWKQQLSLTFTNPAAKDRGRAYFFKDKESLQDAIKHPSTIQDNDPRLVAVEPENYVDREKNFYLVPILNAVQQDNISLLKIATATIKQTSPPSSILSSNEIAIVFVIDTSISMKPYMNEVKDSLIEAYKNLRNLPFPNQVKFGLVAFRSNVKATPKLEYVTKLYVDPGNPQEEQNFIDIVSNITEASVSSYKFDNDSYAGVLAAINQIQWGKFLARYIVLITDAGAIEANEKLPDGTQLSAVEDLNSETIRDIAQKTKDINIYALHLKTPMGKQLNNHQKAERQYKKLTFNHITNSSLYYDLNIQEGDTVLINDTLRFMTGQWINLTSSFLENKSPDHAIQKGKIREDQLLLGKALRLKYLGAKEGTQVPDIVEGWINDKAQETSPMKVQVNVLLSRSELNTLAEKIKAIIESDADTKNCTNSQAEIFFKQLKKKVSSIVQDPNPTVAEILSLDELLDLPFKSQIMGITEQDWAAWSSSQRESLLSTLRGKLTVYASIEETNYLWHKLSEETDHADEITLVPLDLLP